MKANIEIGQLVIRLPDANSKQFYVFHDLAELFGNEYQSDAVSRLKKELKKIEDLKPKPNIDYEAERASIRTSSAATIYEVVRVIERLTTPEFKAGLTERKWKEVQERLSSWKRPKPKPWKQGDVFALKLADGSFCFGQVLTKPQNSYSSPTFALFDLKSRSENIEVSSLTKSKPITILHLLDLHMNSGKWKVIGHLEKVSCDPNAGPWDIKLKSGSPNILESVANYYWFKTHDYKEEKQLTDLIIKRKSWIERIKKIL